MDATSFAGEPDWRRLFDYPLTMEGREQMERRRLVHQGLDRMEQSRLAHLGQAHLGQDRIEQMRFAHQQEQECKKDAQKIGCSINYPSIPVRSIRKKEKLLSVSGEADQRLLLSIQVKGGDSPPRDGKWYRIDAIPGRFGVHTSTE
jgi:hypothetical protein